ncbi:SseB family protein [Desulfovibrio litoralis]|uniref:SseB protein N-terminal domain-containing protein n=1 Tax=Desulfovibrio litoralis DSM 11393 TaxID=1121455 RepID=A0A1M7SZI4_9BACT|nr:SseB family protein [Desulfovibrio litoralis]SHN63824.1 SseB protein N-terminal domain-containing protein [Desulfovibrio litoralis DSM 11393]
MGLFDFFKSKKKEKNEIDLIYKAIIAANLNPSLEDDCYNLVLESEVLVRTGRGKEYMTFSDGTLPVFSSLEHLLKDKSIDGFPSYDQVKLKEFITKTDYNSSKIIVNPFSEYHITFEIDKIEDDPLYKLMKNVYLAVKANATDSEIDLLSKDFYIGLINSEVFFCVTEEGEFMALNDDTIPIFSSLEHIPADKRGSAKKMKAQGRELFIDHPNCTFMLNPFSKYNKLIKPGLIAWINSASEQDSEPGRIMRVAIPKDALVTIPEEIPEKMLAYLCEAFRKYPQIIAGCISLILFEGEGETTHYLISFVQETGTPDIDMEEMLSSGGGMTQFIEPCSYVDFKRVSLEEIEREKESCLLFYSLNM